MTRNSALNLTFGIGAILCFFLDGSLSNLFAPLLFTKDLMVPNLSLLWLILTLIFTKDNLGSNHLHLEWWAAGIGLAIDWYYVGILGIFSFIFPLIVYLVRKLTKWISVNFLTALLIYEVSLAVTGLLNYFANWFASRIGHTVISSGIGFSWHVLLPTLALNLLFYMLLYFPIRSLFSKYQRNS